ncbi:MAG: SGNH/GDSL hydrolase family protein [bacterium]|nr:SGNH/GDSL hydrolase family protein [bacterium]
MRARRVAFSILVIVLLYCAAELMALAALHVFSVVRGYALGFGTPVLDAERIEELRVLLGRGGYGTSMIVFDPLLGWKLRANHRAGEQHTNAAGIVATREYGGRPPAGITRIAAFGDSFTQCVVPNALTWGWFLEESCPGVEVLNFGVTAYGPDQAYLRYVHEGREHHPDIVLIGYMTENIWRLVNVFRPYADPANAPLVKPRFMLVDGELELIPNPLRDEHDLAALLALNEDTALQERLGRHDNLYRPSQYHRPSPFIRRSPLARLAFFTYHLYDWKRSDYRLLNIAGPDGRYNTGSEAYRILEALLLGWTGEVVRDGAVPVVLVFPQFSDIETRRRGEGPARYEPLLDFMRSNGIRYIDLMDDFQARAPEDLFTPDGHYNGHGNSVVADGIARALQAWGLVQGPCGRAGQP